MIVGLPTTDLNGVKYYSAVSDYLGNQPVILRTLAPTNPAPGMPHRFLYLLPVEPGLTNQNSQFGDGLEEARTLDLQDRYNATLVAPSFNIEPWYADHPTDTSRRLESFMVKDFVPWVDHMAAPGETPERWLVGFSKSGFGGLGLIFRHPDVFSDIAAWDTPAQLSDVNTYSGTLPILYTGMVDNYGTQENFDTYRIPPLVANQNAPFTASNRIWISGDGVYFTPDMQTLDQQMTAAGVVHTFVGGAAWRAHLWSSGWLEGAVQSLAANDTPPQRTFAAPPAVSSDVALLTMAQLQAVIPAAIREWQADGANPTQIQALENAQFEIADLPPTYLGWTFAPEAGAQAHPGLVVLDRTAQGFGWFIDAGTAGADGFTVQLAPTEFHATPGSRASGRFDLLTVVAHELGHVIGLPDILDESNHPGNLMDQTLNPGVRRLAAAELPVNTAPVASSPGTARLGDRAASAPALAGRFSVATPTNHQEMAPSAAVLFEQWWQAGLLSPNPAARAASAALPNVPASLHEAPALLPPPDRVAALLTAQTHSGSPGQAEMRRTAAERTSSLFAMAELWPAFAEWGTNSATA
jgi:hypothetical protein